MTNSLCQCVNVHDTDCDGLARPSCLWRMMQDAANEQMRALGMDAPQLLKDTGRAFLLSRARMQIYAPIRAYDTLTARSWPCESRGYSFLRSATLTRDGEVVCELSSVWALLDVANRKIVPVSEFDDSRFVYGEPLSLEVPFRSTAPKDLTMALVGEYAVSYRDVDLHRHMNNTVYPDVLRGFLPQKGARLSSVTIFYQNEAPLGSLLKVYAASADGTYYLRTVREDGQENVRAEFQFE